jgi:hypothetical protein
VDTGFGRVDRDNCNKNLQPGLGGSLLLGQLCWGVDDVGTHQPKDVFQRVLQLVCTNHSTLISLPNQSTGLFLSVPRSLWAVLPFGACTSLAIEPLF